MSGESAIYQELLLGKPKSLKRTRMVVTMVAVALRCAVAPVAATAATIREVTLYPRGDPVVDPQGPTRKSRL